MSAALMDSETEFQMTGSATEKALSPNLFLPLIWCSFYCRRNVVADAWKCMELGKCMVNRSKCACHTLSVAELVE